MHVLLSLPVPVCWVVHWEELESGDQTLCKEKLISPITFEEYHQPQQVCLMSQSWDNVASMHDQYMNGDVVHAQMEAA